MSNFLSALMSTLAPLVQSATSSVVVFSSPGSANLTSLWQQSSGGSNTGAGNSALGAGTGALIPLMVATLVGAVIARLLPEREQH